MHSNMSFFGIPQLYPIDVLPSHVRDRRIMTVTVTYEMWNVLDSRSGHAQTLVRVRTSLCSLARKCTII